MDDIRIVLAKERHAEGLRTAYEGICRERGYFSLGFVTEGVKRRARKLDGEFTDKLMMAVLFN